MMDPNDIIYAAKYAEICEHSYDHQTDLPGGLWHVDPSAIPEFFQSINDNGRDYVVVSPSSDFGVCYQRYNHPAHDLAKWAKFQLGPQHGYNNLMMPARINPERCNEGDTFSLKCWSYTEATFPRIPDNVRHWFIANCEIVEPRVTAIPFGIHGNKDMLEAVEKIAGHPGGIHSKLLYVNFQFYNTDRYELFRYFEQFDFVTCKREVPFDEYLEDLANHKYVLCPCGNGWDCYRTLEAIYMGCVPILENRQGSLSPYAHVLYPLLYYPNLWMMPLNQLDDMYGHIMHNYHNNRDIERVCWKHWEDRIRKA